MIPGKNPDTQDEIKTAETMTILLNIKCPFIIISLNFKKTIE